MLQDKTIGFIGGGRLCESILAGLLRAKAVPAQRLCVTDVSEERLWDLAETFGVKTHLNDADGTGARTLLAECDVVVLVVKPQLVKGILERLNGAFARHQLVISAVGGVTLQTLQGLLSVSPLIRVMPNTSMQVGRGSIAVCAGTRVNEEHLALCDALFATLGSTCRITESQLSAFTALGGCGPAFAYLFIQALADAGTEQGLPRDLARQVAAEVLAGAGEMVLTTGVHPEQLKDNVCSPGGGTIVGVHALEAGGVRASVMDAVRASRLRMDELG